MANFRYFLFDCYMGQNTLRIYVMISFLAFKKNNFSRPKPFLTILNEKLHACP